MPNTSPSGCGSQPDRQASIFLEMEGGRMYTVDIYLRVRLACHVEGISERDAADTVGETGGDLRLAFLAMRDQRIDEHAGRQDLETDHRSAEGRR